MTSDPANQNTTVASTELAMQCILRWLRPKVVIKTYLVMAAGFSEADQLTLSKALLMSRSAFSPATFCAAIQAPYIAIAIVPTARGMPVLESSWSSQDVSAGMPPTH